MLKISNLFHNLIKPVQRTTRSATATLPSLSSPSMDVVQITRIPRGVSHSPDSLRNMLRMLTRHTERTPFLKKPEIDSIIDLVEKADNGLSLENNLLATKRVINSLVQRKEMSSLNDPEHKVFLGLVEKSLQPGGYLVKSLLTPFKKNKMFLFTPKQLLDLTENVNTPSEALDKVVLVRLLVNGYSLSAKNVFEIASQVRTSEQGYLAQKLVQQFTDENGRLTLSSKRIGEIASSIKSLAEAQKASAAAGRFSQQVAAGTLSHDGFVQALALAVAG